jgi:hypothetical protein
MADEAAILQMIRILPMVEALHNEARIAVNSGQGLQAADYCVSRVNAQIERVIGLTEDDWISELKIHSEQGGGQEEQKMEQVLMASAELKAYLRQRIGIASDGGGIQQIAGIFHQAKHSKK